MNRLGFLFPMKFAIQINAGPYQSQAGESAYQFVQAALSMGHDIVRIFFYGDGILHAFRYATPPNDESHMTQRWTVLAEESGIDLVVCISAAQRRGLLSREEAERQQKLDQDLADGFRISGLGQLVEAMLDADRFIVFGR